MVASTPLSYRFEQVIEGLSEAMEPPPVSRRSYNICRDDRLELDHHGYIKKNRSDILFLFRAIVLKINKKQVLGIKTTIIHR